MTRRSGLTNTAEQESEALEGLWAVLFGGPPSIRCDASMMVKVMVDALPPAGPYTFGAARDGGHDAKD